MTHEDLAALQRAVQALEHPSLAARLTNMVGKPIELIGHALPSSAANAISTAASKGLEAALRIALRTMQRNPHHTGSQRLHKILAMASGAAGGAFGLATLPIELPVSTIIMLRSIAEIARSEGENLSDPESTFSCMQVFALGGRASSGRRVGKRIFCRARHAGNECDRSRTLHRRTWRYEGRRPSSRPLHVTAGVPFWICGDNIFKN